MSSQYIGSLLAVVSVAVLVAATAPRAAAAVTEIDIGINPTYQQVGPTTVNSTGGFFSGRAFLNSASDFDGGTLTWPGPSSPQPLTADPGPPPLLFYQPACCATQADLNANFPTGTYTFNLTNSSTSASQTDSIDYTVSADSLSVPQLSAGSYNGLQGLDAHSGITLSWNSFLQNPNASQSLIFLDISGPGGSVFDDTFSNPATTSVFLPGNTLAPGQSYTLDLNFSERIYGTDANSVPTTIFFDTHTDVDFSTAASVPEPATWAVMLVGLGGLGAAQRGRRRVLACAPA